MEKQIKFNRDFAWKNGFPSGLAGGPFAFEGVRVSPDTLAFVEATKSFQRVETLKSDGFFGKKTRKRYEQVHGKIQNEFVYGYDVSYCQKPRSIRHVGMLRSGFMFAFLKASEGGTVRDAQARAHAEACREAGVLFGYYHFFRFHVNSDARRQAHYFTETIAELPVGELRPVLDLEHKGYKLKKDGSGFKYGANEYGLWKRHRGTYLKSMRDQMIEFCEVVAQRTGVRCLVYSYPNFLHRRVAKVESDDFYKKHELWLSSRRLGYPHIVPGWTTREMVCQQFTSDGTEQTREVYDRDLDVNRTPWGIGPLLARGNCVS